MFKYVNYLYFKNYKFQKLETTRIPGKIYGSTEELQLIFGKPIPSPHDKDENEIIYIYYNDLNKNFISCDRKGKIYS